MRLQIMTMESIIHQTKPFDLLIKSSRHYNKRLYMRKEKFVKMHTIMRGLKVHIQNCTVLCRLLILQHNVFKAFNTKWEFRYTYMIFLIGINYYHLHEKCLKLNNTLWIVVSLSLYYKWECT